ncbi:MAG: glutathione peroxidase [Bacteroidales bacterium]|nr:glutathione peroxidase [Bacteroidales bacterium]
MVSCGTRATQADQTSSDDNLYQFSTLTTDGQPFDMSTLRGKVVLVVNTATQCGFTPQYEALEQIYNRFQGRGFEIIDFPCNQFGAQAPGSDADIHAFCTGTYGVSFMQMAKVNVNGDSVAPVWQWLKSKAGFEGFDTTNPLGARLDQMFRAQDSLYDRSADIKWNFTKFLIDRDGRVVRRFEPTVPMSDVSAAVEALL